MRFQLPQFIETEIKLIGPFTLKQFLWVAAGSSIIFVLFNFTQGVLFFVLALPIAGIFGALAFLKIGDTPLVEYFVYFINYISSPKKYIFKK